MDYKRGTSGNESPAAMRKGRGAMHSGSDVEGGSKSAPTPKKGYGENPGLKPLGSKKR